MTKTVKEMLEAAHSAVKKITVAEAKSMISNDDALLIDVRDAPEIEQSGKITGALHISRGMLEFRADPATPYHNAALRKDRPVILYCASGGREIGRASCRERVCQYVSISVVAVSLKNKKKIEKNKRAK